ncbi:TPA: hypothetical protein HA241_04425 [Candidatus Woesearchaeota archaeon]|nr:hypothetical protein [Candidatus Woesearchaeota archaeon]
MDERKVLGLTELVTVISPQGQEENVIARIDTGATASSIDQELAARLQLGPIILSKVIRSASGVRKRPVIQAKIRLHGLLIEDHFNVADRSHMTYTLLIGQNILKKGLFLVDPLKHYDKGQSHKQKNDEK